MNYQTQPTKNAVRKERRSIILAGCRRKVGTSIEQAADVANCTNRTAAEIIAELVREGYVVYSRSTNRFIEPPKQIAVPFLKVSA